MLADAIDWYVYEAHTSRTTKLSPSFPHRTTLSSLGFSNILNHVLARRHVAHGRVHLLVQLAHKVAGVVGPSPTGLIGIHDAGELTTVVGEEAVVGNPC